MSIAFCRSSRFAGNNDGIVAERSLFIDQQNEMLFSNQGFEFCQGQASDVVGSKPNSSNQLKGSFVDRASPAHSDIQRGAHQTGPQSTLADLRFQLRNFGLDQLLVKLAFRGFAQGLGRFRVDTHARLQHGRAVYRQERFLRKISLAARH